LDTKNRRGTQPIAVGFTQRTGEERDAQKGGLRLVLRYHRPVPLGWKF